MAKSSAVLSPTLGLYIARPNITVPDRALQDGLNFRIREGRLESLSLGWTRFGEFQLNGRVRLVDNFFPKNGEDNLILGTERDLYVLNSADDSVTFLTPRWEEGTAEVSAATPAVVTFSETDIEDFIKVGDKIVFGTAGETDPDAVWYEIASIDGTSQATLTTAVIGAPIAAGVFTARRLFSMDANDWWDTAIFVNAAGVEDQWIAVNGTDWVVSWNGSATQVTLHPEMNFRARAIANYKNMIIYANLVTLGEILSTQMINSDVGFPFNAGDAGTGLSEQFIVHGGSDQIFALVPLNDSLIAYSEKHVVPMDFVGDPEVFFFRVSTVTSGPLGPGAVANFSDHHVFIAADAMYYFDGVSHQEVDMHIWPELIRSQDPIRRLSIFNLFVEEFAELMWAFPLTTDPGAGDIFAPMVVAHVAAYIEPTGLGKDAMPYSRRSFPFSAGGHWTQESGVRWNDLPVPWTTMNVRWNDQSLSEDYSLTMVGDNDGYLYTLNSSQTADGVILPSFVRMARKAIVDGRSRGLIRRFYPFIEATSSGELDVTLRFADHAKGNTDFAHTDAFDMSLPAERFFTSPFRRGRYVEFELGSDEGLPWVLSGYDFDAQVGGRR